MMLIDIEHVERFYIICSNKDLSKGIEGSVKHITDE